MTDPTSEPLDPELLMQHAPGLRALVRSLVLDDARVDDVLQETWLRAMQKPPRNPKALGAWLRVVATRLAHRARRGEQNRSDHERRAARPPDQEPSAASIVQREMARREVVDAVLELREPYRSTILFRYFENLSAREIAERLALPVETVRTRIKRGLAQLRERLDARHGGDPARWHAIVWPVAFLPVTPAKGALVGGGLAAWKAVWLLLLPALLGLAASGLLLGGRAATPPPATVVAFTEQELEPVEEPADQEQAGADEAAAASRRVALDVTPSVAGPGIRLLVEGRVLDFRGAPLPGAEVTLSLTPMEWGWWGGATPGRRGREHRVRRHAVTGESGRFRFSGPAYPETAIKVTVRHPAHAPAVVRDGWHRSEGPLDLGDLVLRPGSELAGRVVDPHGRPVVGARLILRHSGRGRTGFERQEAESGTDGRFTLEHLAAGRWRVEAYHPAWVPAAQEMEISGEGDRVDCGDLRLEAGAVITGRVVAAAGGTPVAEARVWFFAETDRNRKNAGEGGRRHGREPDPRQWRSVSSGVDGRFRLVVPGDRAGRLVAWHPRFGTTALALEETNAANEVVLAMPARGVLVVEVDPAANSPLPEEIRVRLRRVRGEQSPAPLGRSRGSGVHPVRVRARVWEVRGVEPGHYEATVTAAGFLPVRISPVEIAPGPRVSRVRAILRRGAVLAGTVRDGQGSPIAGAEVFLCASQSPDRRTGPGRMRVRTGPNGEFRFPARPAGSVDLVVRARGLRPLLVDRLYLSEGRTVRREVRLVAKGTRLEGRVLGWPRGERGVVVFVDELGLRSVAVVDPESGAYRVDGLAPGRHRAMLVRRRDPLRPQTVPDVFVPAATVVRRDLRAAPRGTLVVDVVGAEAARVAVRLRPADARGVGGRREAPRGPDRRRHRPPEGWRRVAPGAPLTFEGLPPGRYVVEVARPGRRGEVLERSAVEVRGGERCEVRVAVKAEAEAATRSEERR